METSRPAPGPSVGSIAKTFTKILRFGRSTAGHGVMSGVAPKYDVSEHKLKLAKDLSSFSTILSEPSGFIGDLKPDAESKQHQQKHSGRNSEAMESLLANIFAGISAVKAAYAELQVAQSPYDPETIQSADQVVVSELKRLSELKHAYLKRQLNSLTFPATPEPTLSAQIQEQQNLLKTFQITNRKLEADLQHKDSEIVTLQSQLLSLEKQNRAIEAKLHPGRTLAALDDLHLSGLNPTHFLAALRYTVKSVRSFTNLMTTQMETCGWDLDAASAAVHPGIRLRKPAHRTFVFESFVFQKMFSSFQHRDFGLCAFADRHSWDHRRFFQEFSALKLLKARQLLNRISKFCRAKYLGLVHPKMEAAFFGGRLEQRSLICSGPGFPDSKFFEAFAEMARRVWLLHCLFFAFNDNELGKSAAIFQAQQGCRFSEVFVESVASAEEDDITLIKPVVAFTVVPGFQVRQTAIQCKVYLS